TKLLTGEQISGYDLGIVQVDQAELSSLTSILDRAHSALKPGGQLLVGVRNALPQGPEWPLARVREAFSMLGFLLEDVSFIRDPTRPQQFAPPGEERVRVGLQYGRTVEIDARDAWQLAASEVMVKGVKTPVERPKFEIELSIVIPVYNKLEYT